MPTCGTKVPLPQDGQDLVQGFFARLLEKDYLQDVDPLKGRFRSFLLAALKHFLLDQANGIGRKSAGAGAASSPWTNRRRSSASSRRLRPT